LFTEGNGGDLGAGKEKEQVGSPDLATGQKEKGKDVMVSALADVNSALQGMHVDHKVDDPGRKEEFEEERGKKRGTYKKMGRGVRSSIQEKVVKEVGQKWGVDALASDMVIDEGVVEENVMQGDTKKIKLAGLANQSCGTQ